MHPARLVVVLGIVGTTNWSDKLSWAKRRHPRLVKSRSAGSRNTMETRSGVSLDHPGPATRNRSPSCSIERLPLGVRGRREPRCPDVTPMGLAGRIAR